MVNESTDTAPEPVAAEEPAPSQPLDAEGNPIIPPIEDTSFVSGSAYKMWVSAGSVPGTERDFD